MTIKPYHPERLIAQLAVQRVALLTRRVLSTALNRRRNSQITKTDASPVTVADFAVQALLISAIHSAFPSDAFVGEEDASELRSDPELARQVWELVSSTRLEDAECEALLATPRDVNEMCDLIDLGGKGKGGRTGRFWALDPIDGTAAFIKGQQYAVSLALVEDGREVLGVLGCPNLLLAREGGVRETCVDEEGLGLMLSAVRGQGAMVRPIGRGALNEGRRVDRRGEKKAVELRELHFIDSSLSAATLSGKVRELADAAGAGYPGTEIYSSHMRYAALILGGREHVQVRFPASRRPPWCIWDHVGAQLIYTESGAGKITDLRGRPIDFGTGRDMMGNYGLLAADESVHGRILELVTEMLERDGDITPVEA
ncbi:carbohydrate phosphatase [Podospora aff. communis PSN243]|uniref:Carbohydrate phosphatase n=1 Tax=Podospora aff. communis PSN243 TaxID=3040156 RepID=A0AAV9GAU9_9PEZI|nr:carbohydrate phosphatase [Podospora aff. communis PSN243]